MKDFKGNSIGIYISTLSSSRVPSHGSHTIAIKYAVTRQLDLDFEFLLGCASLR